MSLRQKQDELLVHGYINRQITYKLQGIPTDIMNLFVLFYHIPFQLLSFSTKYKSRDGIIYTENNKCIVRRGVFSHRYVLVDIEPVTEGIHCWRVQVC